jgi:predicted nuclease with TOPRIM domain
LEILQLESNKDRLEELEKAIREKDNKIAELNTLKTQLFTAAKNGQDKNKALEKLVEELKAKIEVLNVTSYLKLYPIQC